MRLAELETALRNAGDSCHLLPAGAMTALLSPRGARVLGLFPAPDARNLFWTNPVLADPEALRRFLDAGHWNLGGDRFWIAPEIQYNVRDRSDFFGTLGTPAAIDPGSYAMEINGNTVRFAQRCSLTAYNLSSGRKDLEMEVTVRPARNPAPAEWMEGVAFGGYRQEATLSERSAAPILSESWNLVQLHAGGVLVLPCIGELRSTEYLGDVPEEATQAQNGAVRIAITGRRQFKVGYQAASMSGRMGYRRTLEDGTDSLLVRLFFSNPASLYSEEPPAEPGRNGHSVHVYNDGGDFGGFGEMECSGQTMGGASGRPSSTDVFVLLAYTGPGAAIGRISRLLLGTE